MPQANQKLHLVPITFCDCSVVSYYSCQTTISDLSQLQYRIPSSTVSVNFAPDGRLLRLTPTKHAIYIDYSNDEGIIYSVPSKAHQTKKQCLGGKTKVDSAIHLQNVGLRYLSIQPTSMPYCVKTSI